VGQSGVRWGNVVLGGARWDKVALSGDLEQLGGAR
jgi:hypothetical protein